MIGKGTFALAATVAGLVLLFPLDGYHYRLQMDAPYSTVRLPKLVTAVDWASPLAQTLLLAAGLFLLILGIGAWRAWRRENLE